MDSIETTSNIIFLEFVWKGSTFILFLSLVSVVLWLLHPCIPRIHLRNWLLIVLFLRWERCSGRNSAATVLLRYHWHFVWRWFVNDCCNSVWPLRKLSASRQCSALSVQHSDLTPGLTETGSRGHSCPTATLNISSDSTSSFICFTQLLADLRKLRDFSSMIVHDLSTPPGSTLSLSLSVCPFE